jgi:hypothetical protein
MDIYVSHGDADHLQLLSERAADGKEVDWTVNPAAKPGQDRIVFYLKSL